MVGSSTYYAGVNWGYIKPAAQYKLSVNPHSSFTLAVAIIDFSLCISAVVIWSVLAELFEILHYFVRYLTP